MDLHHPVVSSDYHDTGKGAGQSSAVWRNAAPPFGGCRGLGIRKGSNLD